MRKFILFALFVLIASQVSAQTFVESQNEVAKGSYSPTVDAQFVKPGHKIDFTAWFLTTGTWTEALIGASKSVKPWLWVGLVGGIETDKHPWRVSPEVWVGRGRVSVYATTEHGGSGYWYKATGLVTVAPHFSVGIHTQRFYGTGPMAKLELGRKVALWASVTDQRRVRLGLIKTF